jgi:hypothetical protein
MLREVALLVLVVSACSGVEEGSGSPYDRVDGFCTKWAQAACNGEVVEKCSAADEEACVEAQKSFCESLVPDGRYSSSLAKDCVEAVEKAFKDAELTPEERDTVLRLGPPCDGVLSGEAGEGEACGETADCNTEQALACVKKPGDEEGTCQEPMEVMGGFDCSGDNVVCAEGFYCDGANCLANKGDGASCSDAIPCAIEFNCERPDGSMPDPLVDDATCVAKAEVGSDCEKDSDCLTGICSIAAGSSAGVCSALTVLSPTDPICEDLR